MSIVMFKEQKSKAIGGLDFDIQLTTEVDFTSNQCCIRIYQSNALYVIRVICVIRVLNL